MSQSAGTGTATAPCSPPVPFVPTAGGRRCTAWTCWRLSPPASPDAGCVGWRRPSGAPAAATSGTARGKAAPSPPSPHPAEGTCPRGAGGRDAGEHPAPAAGSGCPYSTGGWWWHRSVPSRAGAALSRASPLQGVPGPALAEAPQGLRPAGTGRGDSGCPVSRTCRRRSPLGPPGWAHSNISPPAARRAPCSLSLPLPTTPSSSAPHWGSAPPLFSSPNAINHFLPSLAPGGRFVCCFFYSVMQHEKSWKT